MLFSADELQNDQELGLVVAKGHVEISQGQRTLLADTVTYNQRTDTITASGHVSLLEPTGEVLFADFVELTNRFNDGFLQDIRGLLSDRSRLAGNTGRRTGGGRLEVRRGVYSPCDLCRDDPTQPPLWQLRAEQMVHDRQRHIIEYRDATLELKGVPILYLPYLAHPDPSVKRQSGLMAPTFGNSTNLGAHITIPYYWAIGPDRDATFNPTFTTDAGQVLAGQYRQRFANGEVQGSGSINWDPTGNAAPGTLVRGHAFSTGSWALDDNWRTGFRLNRATDQTYLRRFHFGGSENFLTSRAYGERFDQRSFLGIDSYAFQTLRQGTNDHTQPIVAPVVDYNWLSTPESYGGRFNVDANMLDLNRLKGTGSHRLSLGSGWSLPFKDSLGGVYELSTTVRGDTYYSTDLQVTPNERAQDTFAGRVFPQAALQWRYPLVRRGANFSQTIEPIVMAVVSPRGGNPSTIPNEDSLAFDFSDNDLFVPNRFAGLDRVDGGDRVDYGLRAAIYGDAGGSSRMLIGQSYRLQNNGGFLPGSGLENKSSDVVGRISVSPSSYFDLIYRYRLDKDNLRPRRHEASFYGGPEQLRLSLNYMKLPSDPIGGDPSPREQITVGVTAGLTRNWTVSVATTRNLTSTLGVSTISSGLIATYRDECLAFITSLTQSGTTDRDIKPGTSLLFSLVFKNLGELAAPTYSTSGVP
ncbi:MAG TPA: LPS assembly protein LptD [Stellaceae bacterium]|nr:LPS assembly protein LptD [Stellaceae bacterium]